MAKGNPRGIPDNQEVLFPGKGRISSVFFVARFYSKAHSTQIVYQMIVWPVQIVLVCCIVYCAMCVCYFTKPTFAQHKCAMHECFLCSNSVRVLKLHFLEKCILLFFQQNTYKFYNQIMTWFSTIFVLANIYFQQRNRYTFS